MVPRVRLELNVELSVETSKPAGALTVNGAVKPAPATVKDCTVDAEPLAVAKLPIAAVEGVMAGPADARATAAVKTNAAKNCWKMVEVECFKKSVCKRF